MPSYTIAIIGAGISGLACASFLAEAGHNVHIFERFAHARPVGSGLMIQPTGLGVLARLGLDERLKDSCARITHLQGRTQQGRPIFDLHYGLLNPNSFALGVHRGQIFQALLDKALSLGVHLTTGMTIDTLERLSDGRFLIPAARDHGIIETFDLVIDASGHHSALAATYGQIKYDRSYPYGALWGVCRDPDQSMGQDTLHQRYRQARMMIGVLPLNTLPNAASPHFAFFWSLRNEDQTQWRARPLDVWKDEVTTLWPDLAPFLDQFHSHDDLQWARYGHKTLKRRVEGRLAFIGDAAHAMSPQLGQGANMGLIDAYILSTCLNTVADLDQALAQYNNQRRAHVMFYLIASAWMTPFFQSDTAWLSTLRDLTFAPMCHTPWLRVEMMRTLAGMKTGLFSHLNPGEFSSRYRV
ncbi:FAD-dependent oxidoreductase [Woodsholea maritima]|uniref:FAD-dependent oxidoreductase n=1 Tax=Woodsholea maritima TaxID=240237 RepID=UPI00035CF24B|nr:NAD(P)/FAD-dependent oxidoreductase [Woodsholea maritima]